MKCLVVVHRWLCSTEMTVKETAEFSVKTLDSLTDWYELQSCTVITRCEISACQVPNGRPKMGTGTPKIFGWSNERENCKPKYSWIAKTNSDGTPNFFPISCPELGFC